MAIKKSKTKRQPKKEDWLDRHIHVFRYYNATHKLSLKVGRLEASDAIVSCLINFLVSKGIVTEKEWHEFFVERLFNGENVRFGNRPDGTQVCVKCKSRDSFHKMYDAKENPFQLAVCKECHDKGF